VGETGAIIGAGVRFKMEGNDYFIFVSCSKGEFSENAEIQIIINYNC